MGSETSCRVEVDGVARDAKVLLETDELIVRGATRVKIPFREIREVMASGGALHVRWGDRRARFDIGTQAAKWAEKIRNPKSVIDKIGVKAGQSVSVVGRIQSEFVDLVKKRVEKLSNRLRKESDVIFLAASSRSDLSKLRKLRDHLTSAGAIWVIRPKGRREITDSDVIGAARAAGLVDVKVVRFSETHSAEKFVIPKDKR
jgi:hypothetical protein